MIAQLFLVFNAWPGKYMEIIVHTQPAFTCLKLTIETLEENVKYVQS